MMAQSNDTNHSAEDNCLNCEPIFLVHVMELMWRSASPVLLTIGLVGNSVNLVVLLGKALRQRASTFYLCVLAIADSGALIFGLLPIWLGYEFDVDTSKVQLVCKIRKYLHFSFADTSVWLICAFSCDRLIAVLLPHKMRHLCTRKRSYIVAFFIFLLALLKNLSVAITRTVEMDPATNETACLASDFGKYIRPWIVLITINMIPFALILTCNVLIVRKMHSMKRSFAQLSRSVQSQTAFKLKVTSMTRMCMSISFAFLILISPSMILLVGKQYWTDEESKFRLASSVGSLCQYTSNSVNFILYCVSGRSFREQMMAKFAWKASKRKGNIGLPFADGYPSQVADITNRMTQTQTGLEGTQVPQESVTTYL